MKKEDLEKMLIEAKGNYAFYVDKYTSTLFFNGKWGALAEKELAKITEIQRLLSSSYR